MKKSFFFLLASVGIIGVGCSKSDDSNPEEIDTVFEAPYEALNSFEDLSSSVWRYEGAKIGDRKFGAVYKSNCLSNNRLVFLGGDIAAKKDSITYESFDLAKSTVGDCSLDFRRTMRKSKMISKGKMFVDIYDYTVKIDTNKQTNIITIDTIKKTYYKGNIDIGFQKDMLRVEDKFTRYSGSEKVYLYFKKW